MSASAAIAAVQNRVAQIESRLGIEPPRASSAASQGSSDFDQVLARYDTSPAQGTTVLGASSSANSATIDELMARISAAGNTSTSGGTALAQVPYADLFSSAGARHGVDPALLAAVAKAESQFNPRAVSHAGAQGLMQLMPGTAKGLGVTDSFDPAQAVDGAARLLKGHLARFGSVELALAAYNAGPGAVTKHGGIPPYAETQAYVPKVLAYFEELRR